MTNQEFIEQIAFFVKKIGPEYGIAVVSPIVAQACNESGYGTSDKAQHHNYFGLKYRPNRVTCSSGVFTSNSFEEENGKKEAITTEWFAFDSMEDGVRGYFQFLDSLSNYDNLKGVTDPKRYLELIKADHYATSSTYVEDVYSCIISNNLTRFDDISDDNKDKEQEEPKMSNSSMVTQTLLSPNCNKPRNNKISKITIHHTAGTASVDAYLRSFEREERQASSNYIVGGKEVGLCVEECNRAWTSSSPENDNMAVTIETVNDGGADTDWHVSDETLDTLIKLCIDICQRNGIRELNFTGDASGNLTMHRYFAATSCPGPYLASKFQYIADTVNAALRGEEYVPSTPETPEEAPSSGDKSIDELVLEVIRGVWGNGAERRERLESAGYNYAEVQAAVDAYYSKPDEDATPIPPSGDETTKLTLDEIVAAVIRGDYGNGDERKARLEEDGYNYAEVQAAVNEAIRNDSVDTGDSEEEDIDRKSIAEIALEVIRGLWGNGAERIERIEAAGYDYNTVQSKVNAYYAGEDITSGDDDTDDEAPSSSTNDNLDSVVDAVIRGDYGNGSERRQRLEAAGYNYDEVQALVNKRYE